MQGLAPGPTFCIILHQVAPRALNAGEYYPASGWRTIIGAKEQDFAALERLLARYRLPILKEIGSRIRRDKDDAEELTQEFIHSWLRRDFLRNVDESKGRFRNFIKRCIVNFLRDHHRKNASDPQFQVIGESIRNSAPPLDPPAASLPLNEAMDVEWARQVVNLALERLEQEFAAARWGSRFSRLRPFLENPENDSYEAAARDLGMTEQAVRTAVSRMRARYGALVEEEIKENVGPDEDWRDELRYFLKLLGHSSL